MRQRPAESCRVGMPGRTGGDRCGSSSTGCGEWRDEEAESRLGDGECSLYSLVVRVPVPEREMEHADAELLALALTRLVFVLLLVLELRFEMLIAGAHT